MVNRIFGRVVGDICHVHKGINLITVPVGASIRISKPV
jgi:hypothetical protein